MNIAVIGGGIAGLSCAWMLGARHRVTLYERHARPGLVASSITVSDGPSPLRIDVPLRVFYQGYYPTLTALYRELGVETQPVDYSASFSDGTGSVFFRYRNLRVGPLMVPFVDPRDLALRHPRRIVRALLRFYREAPNARRRGDLAGRTIDDFVGEQRYPSEFVEGFLWPALATICTCSYTAVRSFPADVMVDYLTRGVFSSPVRRALHGADDVAGKLTSRLAALRCNAEIASVSREGGRVLVRSSDGNASYDHVVLAAQANQSRRLLADATDAEGDTLGAFRYQPIEVIMHTDERLMPARRADWAPVNLLVAREHDQPMATIWLNAVQPALAKSKPLFQTVHPLSKPRDERVLGRARFERPVVDQASTAALGALRELHAEPARRVWMCGSYAQPGIPLLESAVSSAAEVARAIDRTPS